MSGGDRLFIYAPVGRDDDSLRWYQQYSVVAGNAQVTNAVSWATSEELLSAEEDICLWSLTHNEEPRIIWQEKLSTPAALALASPDAGLIATVGHRDRLVKIWRRLSYETDSTRYDVSYLSHPSAVTNLHWRKPWHVEQNLDNLLYTFCCDSQIRVWAHSEPHARSTMQLIHKIDMIGAIQPRTLSGLQHSNRRYGFIVDSRDFSSATEKTVQASPNLEGDQAIDHLLEIARRGPEVCVILDDEGHISAWGLENAGYRNKLPTNMFNIIHVRGLEITLKPTHEQLEDRVQFCTFAGGLHNMSFTILVHHFHGRIDWHDAEIAHLFDTGQRSDRTNLAASWTGHSTSIEKIYSSPNGTVLTVEHESAIGILWKDLSTTSQAPLQRFGTCALPRDVVDVQFLFEDEIVIILGNASVSVLDISGSKSKGLSQKSFDVNTRAIRMLALLSKDNLTTSVPFVVVFEDNSTVLWQCRRAAQATDNRNLQNGFHSPLSKLCTFEPGLGTDVRLLSPVPKTRGGAHSSEATQVLNMNMTTMTGNGTLRGYSPTLDFDTGSAMWQLSTELETSTEDAAMMSISSNTFMAVADRDLRTLSIWNLQTACMELCQKIPIDESIEHLRWTLSSPEVATLVVATAFHAFFFSQNLLDTSSPESGWQWTKQIDIRDFATHPLSDLTWLSSGDLLLVCGQQMFVQDASPTRLITEEQRPKASPLSSDNAQIFTAMATASRPIYHPMFLLQVLSAGALETTKTILIKLHNALKYYSPGEDFPSDLSLGNDSQTLLDMLAPIGTGVELRDLDENQAPLSDFSEQLYEWIARLPKSELAVSKRKSLANIIETFTSIEHQLSNIDDNGLRYLALSSLEQAPQADNSLYAWRNIVFASHTTSHDILVDHVLQRAQDGKLTWSTASASGMFLWLHDPVSLAMQMENVARAEYTKGEDRNPVHASLYYLALRKKSVLQGLWRIAVGIWEKESTLKLLSQNFEQPRWKATALKNAYALLSKRRFEYAAAFFLLGDSLKDAVNVCVHQMKQLDLGIAIARVYEGRDDGPILRNLLETIVLPRAAESGNRWMATWAFQMLDRPHDAVRVLVRPPHEVIPISKSDVEGANVGTREAKHWRKQESSLYVEYLYLRDRLLKAGKWHGIISSRQEWDFVLRCARQYSRMGCDWLGLALVAKWKFVDYKVLVETGEKPTTLVERAGAEVRRKSAETDDGEKKETIEETTTQSTKDDEKKKKPTPTQFQEPTADSLLDAFGF